jgi:hypothetical protein
MGASQAKAFTIIQTRIIRNQTSCKIRGKMPSAENRYLADIVAELGETNVSLESCDANASYSLRQLPSLAASATRFRLGAFTPRFSAAPVAAMR